jgi:ribosomal protein L16 Arg81 hydroxylase
MPPTQDDGHGPGAPITVTRRRITDDVARKLPVVHQFAALAFYTSGTAEVEQRVRWRLRTGDVLIVPAGEPHRAINAAGTEFWGVALCAPCTCRARGTRIWRASSANFRSRSHAREGWPRRYPTVS